MKADSVILTFDLTNQGSFDNLEYWISSVENSCKDGVPRILIGNKLDLKE